MNRLSRRELLAGMATGASVVRAASARQKPNLIVILTDDQGYSDVGFHGCKDIPTPNMDSLAKGGVRFTSGYVSHPYCSPTRAGLMTGRYQQRFGHEDNPHWGEKEAGLPVSETTLPQVLRKAGYVTGMVGKWHLGEAPKFHPMKRGFQEMFGFLSGGHDYFKSQMEGATSKALAPIEHNGKPVPWPPSGNPSEYLTHAFAREAAAFIRRHRQDPFFLYLAFNAPHRPQQAPDTYLNRFDHIPDKTRRFYAAMVNAVDDAIGRVLSVLRELKLEHDTLIWFLSDNGGTMTGARNHPLRARKGSMFEGGIRVPFVMWWPGRLQKGGVFHHPVISLDIFPTMIAAAGVEVPVALKLDGVNLLPYVDGKTAFPPHDCLFWRDRGGIAFAVREGRYKLVQPPGGALQLYDLEADIGERKDLSASRPQLVEKLLATYKEWNKEMIPPRF